MANRIVSVHAGFYGMGIYAIMLPSSGFSVAHFWLVLARLDAFPRGREFDENALLVYAGVGVHLNQLPRLRHHRLFVI